MIGRHQECQIRPKSRSVSRRHCLILFQGDLFQALDLGSTAGTFLNDERITEKTWYPISDGDRLRCGKIEFQVCQSVVQNSDDYGDLDEEASGSMVSGEAWQEVDVASYLTAEDEAEREERYGSIRQRHQSAEKSSHHDIDIFEDDFGADFDTEVTTEVRTEQDNAVETSEALSESLPPPKKKSKSTEKSKPKEKSKAPKLSAREKRKKPKVSRVRGGLGGGLFQDSERWKLIGVVVITILTLCILGYSIYSNTAGSSSVRVIQDTE